MGRRNFIPSIGHAEDQSHPPNGLSTLARVDPAPSSWYPAWGELSVFAIGAATYAAAVRRFGASPARVAAFVAAEVMLVAIFVSPVETLALHYLLTAHLVQNVALAEWVPALVVIGISEPMADALARRGATRALTFPFVALPLWIATYAVWHVPALYDAALDHPGSLLQLEHVSYFVAGVLLWWPVLHAAPWKLTAGAKAAYLFGAFFFASPLGLLFALLPDPLYDFYVDAPRVGGISALTDQQIAGLVMAASEAVVFFCAFAFFFVRFMSEEDDARYSPRDA
jgi:putative membrane protein